MGHIVEIADEQQTFLRLLRLAHKDDHTLLLVTAVDPLEALRVVIHGVHGRIFAVNLVERLHIILHLPVRFRLKQLPVQRGVLVPLPHLGEILAHEQQLFAGMAHHKPVCGPQILRLLFQVCARHLSDHGSLAVHHLVVGEYQNKVLAVSVQHGERQLTVIIFAEQRVAAHVVGEVVHPTHVPLEVKAQSALLRLPRDHGPCGGFLGDQHRAVLAALENRA